MIGRPAARAPFNAGDIPDNTITAAKIVAGAVDADIGAGAVDATALGTNAVTTVKINADAIINIRFTSAMVMQGASETLAYGTAVRLK